MQELKNFQRLVFENAVQKGWYDEPNSNAKNFMLMVTELAEATEADRAGNPPSKKIPEFSHIEEELADCMIRILDFAEANDMDVIGAMQAKHLYNTGREFKHGGKGY